MTQFHFDATKVEPAKALEPVPTDWYICLLTAAELKPTSGGTGEYANLEATIQDGPYKGRKLYPRVNTKNANAQAVEIGAKEMSAICHAVGVLQLSDLTQLLNRPLEIRTVVRPPENGYDATNEIKGYRAPGSGQKPAGNGSGQAPVSAPGGYAPPPSATPPPPAAAPAPTPAAPPAGVPSWASPPPAPVTPPPPTAAPTPPPPPPPPAPPPAGPQRPTDPSHIHAAGTPGEMWWINGAWVPAAAAPTPPPPPAASNIPSWARPPQ